MIAAARAKAGSHHASFLAGAHGWYIGVLRMGRTDVWECGHQHENRKAATRCAQHTIDAITGVIWEPVRWRRNAR